MDFIVSIILLFLLLTSIIVGLIYLAFWIPKRLGKRKLGLWLSGILTLGILTLVFVTVFEDQLFSQSDAKTELEEHSIELRDNFEIISNESGGLRDYYHKFVLTITPKDKELIIKRITTADNYKDEIEDSFELRLGKDRYSDAGQAYTANYQDSLNYVYEFYKPNKLGTKPTWDKISVSKTENKLIYERILD